jgi:hypothetical protein
MREMGGRPEIEMTVETSLIRHEVREKLLGSHRLRPSRASNAIIACTTSS